MDYKNTIAESISNIIPELETNEVYQLLEKPKVDTHGDLAFPTFQLAKIFRKNPAEIAGDLAEKISHPLIKELDVVGPYINFFLDKKEVSKLVINEINTDQEAYGDQNIGNGNNVPIDMSSPNIAKPMSMGHLRSTVIGNSLSKILRKVGFNPVKINHLGDWGTQFGKLITAYEKWGNEDDVRKEPIKELLSLYVKFHEEAETNPSLEDEGRAWFKALEDGNEEALNLWEWFRSESLKEFQTVYDRLNITFDSNNGEAFYNDKMQAVVDELNEKNLLKLDDGASVVDLEAYDLNPALIKRTDGATLYITRDIAAAMYRFNEYNFDQSLYVVGNEQSYHFKQLKAVLKEMGHDWHADIHHVPFGLITKDGKKLSTRKGKVVLLEDVLNEASKLALEQINDKNPSLENKEQIAEQVGVGAVVFHDLKNDRLNNFDFTIDEVVQFEGETGPYVQYTRARSLSILGKGNFDGSKADYNGLDDDYSFVVVKMLQEFPDTLARAYREYEPSIIAKYSLNLAQAFNKYYANVRILEDNDSKYDRLGLVNAVQLVLKISLDLLGVESPEKM